MFQLPDKTYIGQRKYPLQMSEFPNGKSTVHYSWYIVLTGMLCILACLGFARFALGMLLPSMTATLNLNYAQVGFIGTVNFAGYLVSVLVTGFIYARIGARKLIFFSTLLTGITLVFISQAESYLAVLFFYTLTGLASGAAIVSIMTLVTVWFVTEQRGKAAGFVVSGNGFAILIAGKLIPFINSIYGLEGWRLNWFILGITTLVIAFICLLVLKNKPEEMGLQPFGTDSSIQNQNPSSKIPTKATISLSRTISHLGAIYFLFGFTYVIYATFFVTTLVEERGFSETTAGNYWAWVGAFSLLSGPVFGTLSDKLGRKIGLVTVFTCQMGAYVLVASNLPGVYLYLSVFLFGVVAWSIPPIMVALVSDSVSPKKIATVFGYITFIFGVGQVSGPAIAGILADISKSFSTSFLMAAVLTGCAILLTLLLKKP